MIHRFLYILGCSGPRCAAPLVNVYVAFAKSTTFLVKSQIAKIWRKFVQTHKEVSLVNFNFVSNKLFCQYLLPRNFPKRTRLANCNLNWIFESRFQFWFLGVKMIRRSHSRMSGINLKRSGSPPRYVFTRLFPMIFFS